MLFLQVKARKTEWHNEKKPRSVLIQKEKPSVPRNYDIRIQDILMDVRKYSSEIIEQN